MRLVRNSLSVFCFVCAGSLALPARAQTPEELAQGRKTFAQALDDEEHQRFAAALEKYKRVQQIKDTINVRYRIGTSLEGLGRIAQALDAYKQTVQIGAANAAETEVLKAASAKVDVLQRRVAHLALKLPPGSPEDAEVAIDGAKVDRASFADLALDPGSHVITASAANARPFHVQMVLSEGGRAEIAVVLESTQTDKAPAPPRTEESSWKTVGAVSMIGGGVLVISGVVLLVIRKSDISTLQDACPNGDCPSDREKELTAKRDQAELFGPLGIGLVAVGAVAAGTGAALYFFTVGGKSARLAPSMGPRGGMLTFRRVF